MQISREQHKVARELVDLVASKFGAGRAVQSETAIACVARLAGSLFFRSFSLKKIGVVGCCGDGVRRQGMCNRHRPGGRLASGRLRLHRELQDRATRCRFKPNSANGKEAVVPAVATPCVACARSRRLETRHSERAP